ncbi:MAG: ABC transporter ATP-binding protein [Bacilli bacterium]|nr:ABC transporter ATP-binding protein [Bacilli bacterium]
MDCIQLEHITKTFGDVIANDDVSFVIEKGEVLAILGENGSGKTTLLNVLGGIYRPDHGKVLINGEEATILSPKDAYSYGIGMVHQHYQLVEAFTAIENVVLGLSRKELLAIYDRFEEGQEQHGFRWCRLRDSAKHMQTMCERYGFALNPKKTVSDMSVAEKQTLEIVKVLFRGVDTLILDEPTAVLTPQEAAHLFDVIRNMKRDGKTIILITHKLNEVKEISDRVVIMRKGKYIQTIPTAEASEKSLAEAMVGESLNLDIPRSDIPTTGERLEVRGLSVRNREGRAVLSDVSFTLYGSEILGIAGVSGSGQRELLEAIAGLCRDRDGDIIFHNPKKDKPVTFFHKNIKQIRALAAEGKLYFEGGKPCDLRHFSNKEIADLVNQEKILFYEDEIVDFATKTPLEIRNLGAKLSFVPEDRLGMGLVGDMDLIDNVLLRSYRKGRGKLLHKEKSEAIAQEIVTDLEVATPSLSTPVRKLSGGNIQKVLVGREIMSHPKILMVAYPVRGLDINASYTIYHLIDEQKKAGTAIMYVGEDLDAMLGLTDRILVLCDGKVTGIVDSRAVTKEQIGLMMSGKTYSGEANA